MVVDARPSRDLARLAAHAERAEKERAEAAARNADIVKASAEAEKKRARAQARAERHKRLKHRQAVKQKGSQEEGDGAIVPGDRVAIIDGGDRANARTGEALWAGLRRGTTQRYVGVRLDVMRTTSTNDGVFDGVRMCRTKPGFMMFVEEADVVHEHKQACRGSSGSCCDVDSELDALVGREAAKDQILDVLDACDVNRRRVEAGAPAERSPSFLVLGEPGAGVSTVAALLAQALCQEDITRQKSEPTVATAEELTARSSGTDVGMALANKATRGVILLDDAQRLLDGSGRSDSAGLEALTALARSAEKPDGPVLVIAGRREGSLMSCPVIQGLLPHTIILNDFTSDELSELVAVLARRKGFTVASNAVCSPSAAGLRLGGDMRNANAARAILQNAVHKQTVRVHKMGAVSRDKLLHLEMCDFEGDSASKKGEDPVATALSEVDAIVGLPGVKTFIRELSAQIRVDQERQAAGLPIVDSGSLHMVFAGNPGTGKTTVARIVADLLKGLGVLRSGQLVEADRSSLVAGYSGQTAIKTQAVVQQALGGVLFVDEAYTLVNGDKDSFGREALDTLMKLMEDHRKDLVVIFAGYAGEMKTLLAANPGMASRFPTTIVFEDYKPEELMAIADSMLGKLGLRLAEEARSAVLQAFQRIPPGSSSNGRSVRNLIEQARRRQALRLASKNHLSKEALMTLTVADVTPACDALATP